MHQYLIYNQKVSSEIAINLALPIIFTEEPDVQVTIEKAPLWITNQIKQGIVDNLTETMMWFYVPHKAIFLIENGNHIRIEWFPDLTELELSSYLMGSGFALLLMQKGIIPVHGSVINYGEQTLIVTGRSGAGKSTTVFELLKQGCKFLSDDIAAVSVTSEEIMVFPASPLQKLCRDIVEKYTLEKDTLIYIDESRDKFARKLDDAIYMNRPKNLTHIIELIPCDENDVSVKKVQGIEKLAMLTSNLYRGHVYEEMGVTKDRFEHLIQIVSNIQMYQIFRPKEGDSFQEVQTVILDGILQKC